MALFEFGDYSYQEITLKEKLLEVLSYLLRIGDFKQYAGKTSHRRKACACAVFEQKEKRQAEQESRRKTYNLPFGKVERYFCLDFG